MNKQTVYLPVKVEEMESKLQEGCDYIVKDETGNVHLHYWYNGEFYTRKGEKVVEVIHPQKGYFFTPEQLNEYTQSVIKQALEAAAENASMKEHEEGDWDVCLVSNDMGDVYVLDKQSITNTLEQTYKKFEV